MSLTNGLAGIIVFGALVKAMSPYPRLVSITALSFLHFCIMADWNLPFEPSVFAWTSFYLAFATFIWFLDQFSPRVDGTPFNGFDWVHNQNEEAEHETPQSDNHLCEGASEQELSRLIAENNNQLLALIQPKLSLLEKRFEAVAGEIQKYKAATDASTTKTKNYVSAIDDGISKLHLKLVDLFAGTDPEKRGGLVNLPHLITLVDRLLIDLATTDKSIEYQESKVRSLDEKTLKLKAEANNATTQLETVAREARDALKKATSARETLEKEAGKEVGGTNRAPVLASHDPEQPLSKMVRLKLRKTPANPGKGAKGATGSRSGLSNSPIIHEHTDPTSVTPPRVPTVPAVPKNTAVPKATPAPKLMTIPKASAPNKPASVPKPPMNPAAVAQSSPHCPPTPYLRTQDSTGAPGGHSHHPNGHTHPSPDDHPPVFTGAHSVPSNVLAGDANANGRPQSTIIVNLPRPTTSEPRAETNPFALATTVDGHAIMPNPSGFIRHSRSVRGLRQGLTPRSGFSASSRAHSATRATVVSSGPAGSLANAAVTKEQREEDARMSEILDKRASGHGMEKSRWA